MNRQLNFLSVQNLKAALVCVLVLFVSVAPQQLLAQSSNKGKTATTATPGQPSFQVGFAERDITPPAGVPMWGYGARHDMLAEGKLDSLMAKAVVIQAGDDKVALVGLDIGRGPTTPMMKEIRAKVKADAGIEHVLIVGSHTHHGPVIELMDKEGFGKGRLQKAVDYNLALPGLLIEAILEADKNATPASIGVASKDLDKNRNRQTKRTPKPTDPMLAVIRFNDAKGLPIAVLVNYAAHPVMTDGKILKFSADYPGFLQRKVEKEMKTHCLFMQGACGDLSPNPVREYRDVKHYGEDLADHAIELVQSVKTSVPEKPSIKGDVNRFRFKSRVDFGSVVTTTLYAQAFFPEIVRCFSEEFEKGIPAELNTVVINQNLAIVGGSGEFFCNHSNRLKSRSYIDNTLFFGYCNGHSMYFPTIEATSEGGYGADSPVSPVAVGAGERMMDKALINIYEMLGKYDQTPQQ